MKSYIHFIRHGITEGNLKGWYYGSLDIPLAPEGISALQKLKTKNLYPPVAGADCYTSGLLRTEQTFAVIYGDVPHQALPMLKEMNFGAWEGMSFAEIEAADTHRDAFDEWVNTGSDETGFTFPGGDSINSFYARVREGIKDLLGRQRLKELSCRHNGKNAVSVVVCHGGVIAAAMEDFFPGEKENFWKWIPEPGHGYTVYFEEGKATRYEAF